MCLFYTPSFHLGNIKIYETLMSSAFSQGINKFDRIFVAPKRFDRATLGTHHFLMKTTFYDPWPGIIFKG